MTKKCTKCGEDKEIDQYSKARSGLTSKCKSCVRAYNQEYYKKNSDTIRASSSKWYKDNPDKAKSARTKYYKENKDKIAEYHQEWAQKNKERLRVQSRSRSKRWRKANPEKISEINRKMRRLHPATFRAKDQRRRARKARATVEIFTDVEVFESDRYICYLCGIITDPTLPVGHPTRTVLEHKIPLSRGGDHSLVNCSTACWRCNSDKYTMTEEEYYKYLSI